VKVMEAETVKYRDPATGKMSEARVPAAVLALLRIQTSCSGKEVSEQRIARMGLDVMEEQGYDPIRAVSSLSPSSLLCPTSAMRLLGSGFGGVVFMEEETGNVVKVLLDEFAPKEYDIFQAFAKVGLAPKPFELGGPTLVPGGELHCIRMEKIPYSLSGVLSRKIQKGPRHGFQPPSEQVAQRMGERIAKVLQTMWDHGLVHGDLHLENVGLQDLDAEQPFQLLDFGRSASTAGWQEVRCKYAFLAGHEYDVYRLISEMCTSFDELEEEFNANKKECQKEVRELQSEKKERQWGKTHKEYQLHHERQIVGLQAYMAEEPKTLEELEIAYTAIISATIAYANTKFDLPYDGVPTVRSRRMRKEARRRENASYAIYFKSDLFWGCDRDLA